MIEERRHDVELKVMAAEITNLSKQFDHSEVLAAEWRNRFCKKLDIVSEKLDRLPCERGEEVAKAMGKDIGWLQKIVYSIIVVGVPSLITLAVAWGALNNTVSRNTTKWDVLDKEHTVVLQDLSVLKSAVRNEPSRIRT